MKLIGLLLTLACAAPAFGWGGDYDHHHNPQPNPPPYCDIRGGWRIVSHSCASGAWPMDGFVAGRDRFEMNFDGRIFNAYFGSGYCTRWSTGFYDFNPGFLTLHVTQSQANCGPADFGTISYPISNVSEDGFTVVMGPMGFGGACPPGDVLYNTFQRAY